MEFFFEDRVVRKVDHREEKTSICNELLEEEAQLLCIEPEMLDVDPSRSTCHVQPLHGNCGSEFKACLA